MNTEDETSQLLQAFAGYEETVEEILRFGRSHQLFSLRPSSTTTEAPTPNMILQSLMEKGLAKPRGFQVQFERELSQPRALVRVLLAGARPDHELRYFTARSIRRFYKIVLSPSLARDFHALCEASNRFIATPKRSALTFCEHLSNQTSPETLDFFIEACFEAGYLSRSFREGNVHFKANYFEAEYLISNLFGMPTGIQGLDDLFGGGGPLLYEASHTERAQQHGMNGRAVLIRGRFGTGKTILALQLAVEVARKGGLAWVVPLEQSPQECEYTIESMGGSPHVKIVTKVLEANKILREHQEDGPRAHRGIVIILKVEQKSLTAFLESMIESVLRMRQGRQYLLRLLVIDPVNTVHVDPVPTQNEIRTLFQTKLEEIRRHGTNVVLVAEGNMTSPSELGFAENVADTVIHLAVVKKHGYAQRYIEITKSRMQREQRGAHPFSIVSGAGMRIFPSTPAVSARLRNRVIRYPNSPTRFGVEAIDGILGANGFKIGDVVVLQGSEGAFRTSLGLRFLLGSDYGRGRRIERRLLSLFIDARIEEQSIRHQIGRDLKNPERSGSSTSKHVSDIEVCSLPGGYIQPGFIFQRVEEIFLEAEIANCFIDRVVLDNVANWELSCPFVREDETFGSTLVDLMRRYRRTSLFICTGTSRDPRSVIQRSIIDNADCVIKLDKVQTQDTHRVMVRVLKTRDMAHEKKQFELVLEGNDFRIQPMSNDSMSEGGGR